jgi:L-lactate dehydrogenase
MRRRVGIIGTGWVGSSVAISVLHSGIADEMLLHDIRPGLAEGEAMDLAHGASFYPSAQVRAAAIEEMIDADAVSWRQGEAAGPGSRGSTCSARTRQSFATSGGNSMPVAAFW